MSETEKKKLQEDEIVLRALEELEESDYVAWDKGCKYATGEIM